MRSISELLDDASSHVSLAVPRNLKDGSPPPSSSSDSDEDIDELPFIPMPHTMMFSGSRMSLTEIHEDDDNVIRGSNESYKKNMNQLDGITESQMTDGQKKEDYLKNTKRTDNSLQRGSSVEVDQVASKTRRGLMRRGSSADSALLLQITAEDGDMKDTTEDSQKHMKKAVSMELPHRSSSPKTGKLSKEDYALKLDLMRQRLLKGCTVNKNMSGLRGPLLETLGVEDERRTSSLDRNLRRARLSASGDPGTFYNDNTEETCQKSAFRKRSLRNGNSESISLHRRSGAPLEIPSISAGDHNALKITSTIMDENNANLPPVFPREISSKPPTPDLENKQVSKEEVISDDLIMNSSQSAFILEDTEMIVEEMKEQDSVPENIHKSTESPLDILPHDMSSNYCSKMQGNGKKASSVTPLLTPFLKISQSNIQPTTGQPGVFAFASSAHQPNLRSDIKDIDSEEIFEARFKKRESSLAHGLKRLTRTKSEESSPVPPRKSDEVVYRPGPVGSPLEFGPGGLKEKSKSVQDLREVDKEFGLGLIGRFSMRARRLQPIHKKEKEGISDSIANKRQITWAMGRSKSLDKKENFETNKENLEKDTKKNAESPVLAVRRKFESNVSGVFDKMHSRSKDRKDKETKPHLNAEDLKVEKQDMKKINDSPVLALRKKFESKVSGFSLRKQSQSEGEETKNEGKKTPLFSRHHRSQSDGLIHKKMDIPENQLPLQTTPISSKETLNSSSSAQSIESSQSMYYIILYYTFYFLSFKIFQTLAK